MDRATSFQTFLDILQREKEGAFQAPVTLFVAREYPLLFFSSLLRFFAKNLDAYVIVIDLKTMSKIDVQQQLQGSFLGLKTVFWLGSLTDLSPSEQQWLFHFLASYKGPHYIMAYSQQNDQQKTGSHSVEIPDSVSFDIIVSIASLTAQTVDRERLLYFFKKVIEVTGILSVDQASLLLSYFIVAGKNNSQFCTELLPSIIPPQLSLFALSDALFEKNSKKFMTMWSALSSQFSMQFWIAFWSEQFWRAYFYLLCMQSGRIADAKKVSYRLPYSFTQKSWKRYSFEQLLKGHTYLYELDHACKNGAVGQEAMLDLFCFEFMNQ